MCAKRCNWVKPEHKLLLMPACVPWQRTLRKTDMRFDDLFLWYLGNDEPRYVGALKLVAAGKGVSLRYDAGWLASGFALSEYLPRKGGPLPRLEQAQALSEVVAKVEAGEALTALEAKIIQGGGSPLGGG